MALRGVDFTVQAGQIVGLLGPNGAGKTTALRILVGLLAPTAGTARVAGRDTLTDPVGARRALGWLPDGAPLYPEMTARALLAFVARAHGLGPAERARALERVTTDCGLGDRLSERIGTLSRGYRQRVGLAAALIHDPPLLVLDEPTTGLDPNQVVEIRGLIRRLGRDRTVLWSTHVLSEVEATCDRVLILHQGRLVADERTSTLLARARGSVVHLGVGPGKVTASLPALVDSVGRVPGVTEVRPEAPMDGVHRLEVHADRDVRADLFRWAVDHGHLLVELRADTRNLEDVFRQLTEAA